MRFNTTPKLTPRPEDALRLEEKIEAARERVAGSGKWLLTHPIRKRRQDMHNELILPLLCRKELAEVLNMPLLKKQGD